MSFALDVLTNTLEAIRANDPERWVESDADDAFDCDWEESDCPTCGRTQDKHTSAMMTRCAMTTFNTRY